MRRYWQVIGLVILVLAAPPMYSTAAQTPDAGTPPVATPTATSDLASLLPDEGDVPEGLVIFQDGERTLDDVTGGFSDPEEAAELFEQWGWQGNVVRAFRVEDSTTADPTSVDGIYISIHGFGSAEAAAEALEFSVEEHLALDPALTELGHEGLGEASHVLFGEEVYGNEITIYVQQDDVVIRLSANSPEGDPEDVAFGLTEMMVENVAR